MSTKRGGRKRKGGAALTPFLAPLALLALRSQLKGKSGMKLTRRRRGSRRGARRGTRRSRR